MMREVQKQNEMHISSSSPSFEQQQQQMALSDIHRSDNEMNRKTYMTSSIEHSINIKQEDLRHKEHENEAAAALLGLETTSRRKMSDEGESRSSPIVKQEGDGKILNRSGSYREGDDEKEKKHIHGTPESASYVSPVSASSVVHDYGETEERVPHFPTQLHEVLSNSELAGIALEWLPHGKAWRILRWEGLGRDFLARYFPQCGGTPDSFLWHVNSWGFKEVKRGPDRGSYFHALFLRDNLKLCQQMPWPISYVVQAPRSPPKSRYMVHEDDYDDETYYYYKNKGMSIPSVPGYHGPPRTPRDDCREEMTYRRPSAQYEYDPHGPPPSRPWKSSPDDEYYLLHRGPPPFHNDHPQNVFRHRIPKQPSPYARSPGTEEKDSPWLQKHHSGSAPTRPFPVVTSESQSSTPERDHHTSQATKPKPSYSALTPPYYPATTTPRPTPDRMVPPDHPEVDAHNSQHQKTPPSAIRPSTMPLYSSIYNETTPPSSNTIPVRSCRGGRRRSPLATTTSTQSTQQPPKKKFTMSSRGGMKQVIPTNIESPIGRIPKVSPESGPKDFPVAVAISRKKRKVEEHHEV